MYTGKDVYEFIAQQSENPIVEWKTCAVSGKSFAIFQEDIEYYKQIEVPIPKLCPEERMRRRMMFRNERHLYKRKCDKCGASMISIYAPEYTGVVYCQNCWWSDERDELANGKYFDFHTSFTEQYKSLFRATPQLTTTVQNSENCDYTNDAGDSKNCYLSFRVHYCENVMYSYRPNRSTNCIDCYQVKESENLYECFECNKCQNSKFLYKCKDTHTSTFLWNCIGCHDCFMCFGLNNAEYCFLNKSYTKEKYLEKINQFQQLTHKKILWLKEQFENNLQKILYKNLESINSPKSTGNELINCNYCHLSFMMKECNGSKYSWDNIDYTDSMDNYSGGSSTLCYDTSAIKKGHNVKFSLRLREPVDCMYSLYLFSCKNCFGCVGLRNKEYCILNKQYSREEYESLVPQIVAYMKTTGEWGEFFAHSVTPFAYNETVAHEYFPLIREEALARGYNWQDNNYDPQIPVGVETLKGNQIPDDILLVDDSILDKILLCEVSNRPFRIIKAELEFYRTHNIPLPRLHPDIRHQEKLKKRNPRHLVLRSCSNCHQKNLSIYSENSGLKVYCEQCYDKAAY